MLSFIPTPIGNKEDITLRALRLFRELEIFFCEDTRTFMNLLRMYDIPLDGKQFHAFGSFNSPSKLQAYLKLAKDHDCGVVSEAGTPGLSDPGKTLIQICNEHQLPFDVLPGANALIPALVSAWFDTSDVRFAWFVPHKKGKQTLLKSIISSDIPVFVYESVHRVVASLQELEKLWYQGQVFLGREISKMFQQCLTASLGDILLWFQTGAISCKGEFVLGFYPLKTKRHKT